MEVRFARGELRLDEALACVRGPGRGGVAVFLGDVREAEDGKGIAAIEYEAYEGMARRELGRIVSEAEARHGATIAIFHRLGPVPAGETSVVVAAAAAHRAEAFAACREAIDRLKETAPIWKASFVSA